jgi:hypothetical protein
MPRIRVVPDLAQHIGNDGIHGVKKQVVIVQASIRLMLPCLVVGVTAHLWRERAEERLALARGRHLGDHRKAERTQRGRLLRFNGSGGLQPVWKSLIPLTEEYRSQVALTVEAPRATA